MAAGGRASSYLENDVLCPQCGYNLRGLPRGTRCPECGIHPAFYGSRNLSKKQTRRVRRRLVAPLGIVGSFLFFCSPQIADPDPNRFAADLATTGGVHVLLLAAWIAPDVRRYVRVRRRDHDSVQPPAQTIYLVAQIMVLALIVGISTISLIGWLVPPPRSYHPVFVGVGLFILLIQYIATQAAFCEIPALLARRRRSQVWSSAIIALLVVPAGTIVIFGCLGGTAMSGAFGATGFLIWMACLAIWTYGLEAVERRLGLERIKSKSKRRRGNS